MTNARSSLLETWCEDRSWITSTKDRAMWTSDTSDGLSNNHDELTSTYHLKPCSSSNYSLNWAGSWYISGLVQSTAALVNVHFLQCFHSLLHSNSPCCGTGEIKRIVNKPVGNDVTASNLIGCPASCLWCCHLVTVGVTKNNKIQYQ